jgi:hypothetical protein
LYGLRKRALFHQLPASRKYKQQNKDANNAQNYAGVTVQIHAAFSSEQVCGNDKWSAKNGVYKDKNTSHDEACRKDC